MPVTLISVRWSRNFLRKETVLYLKITALHGTVGAGFLPQLGVVRWCHRGAGDYAQAGGRGAAAATSRGRGHKEGSNASCRGNLYWPLEEGKPPRERHLHGSRVPVIRVTRGCCYHDPLSWNYMYSSHPSPPYPTLARPG